MSIHRQSDSFAVIPKEVLRDDTLSFRARGVFAFISSFDEDEIPAPEGESEALEELRKKGHIR